MRNEKNEVSVDFVVTWVNGNDPEWLRIKAQYQPEETADDSLQRYRDFGLLRYWFRGVEQFAPWVRRVHMITFGHLPEWLNTANSRLHIVRHSDYLPEEALPCFNSNAIELSMHKIDGLAERFVYFNDDMFLIRPVQKEDFFYNGLPVEDAILSPVIPDSGDGGIGKTSLNNMYAINRHFQKRDVFRNSRGKFISARYGTKLLRTFCMLPWHHFPGFYNDHLPAPYLKSTFADVWSCEAQALQKVTLNRFRDCSKDLSHWLMRYWQFCSGHFHPGSPNRGKDLDITSPETYQCIKTQRYRMICINDTIRNDADLMMCKQKLHEAFESILPEKSAFEQ